jgi:hypothetical protein
VTGRKPIVDSNEGKKLNQKSMIRLLSAVAAVSICSLPSLADPSYSLATKNLPVGAVLSKSNIKEVVAAYPHPAGAISGCSILYGCKIYAPLKKGNPITDSAVCAGRWSNTLDPKENDPAWVKAQKAAETALKANELSAASHDCEIAIAELEKLAKNNQRITDFTEMSHLMIPYTEVELAVFREERHKHVGIDQRTAEMNEYSKKQLALSQRLLDALKVLLPQDNFYLVSQMQDVQHKKEDLQTSEQLANMAKSVAKATSENQDKQVKQ